MKVLVVGSGGREHTICWKISQSPRLGELYCAPGNAGTARLGVNLDISDSNISGLVDFCVREKVDLTMVGPEAPLASGIVDRFREARLAVVGPNRRAAILEGSKAFAKDFMRRHGIPSAGYRLYEDPREAESDLSAGKFDFPVVLKADGLAAGKGVLICADLAESLNAVRRIMRDRQFGDAGKQLVVEDFLVGEEASFMVLTDGEVILPLVPSRDHKAIYEGDLGPNTGGMGAYSAEGLLPSSLRDNILSQVIEPTVVGMREEDRKFQGVLYAGLMLTENGPKVLEFNVRFGDPETQVVLPRLQSDFLELLVALADGDLSGCELEWTDSAAVCVVVAAQGYPGSYPKGMEITGLEMAEEVPETFVFHAGTRLDRGRVVTSGGRVLAVTSVSPSLGSAIIRAYEGVNKIHFDSMYCRRDIAAKGSRQL